MRSEWETVRLSDVCDLVAGFAFKSKDFGSFEDKVIKITHIVPPTVAMDSLVGVNLKKYDKGKLGRYVAGVGDYVLAMTGATVGKLGRIEHGHAYINQRVLLFKNYTNVDKDFLYYVLSQRIFEQYVLNYIDSESAQANISAGTIGKFTFQMPPLGVQKKIGRLLRIIDEKCVLNKKINDNLQLQVMALFHQMFDESNSNRKNIRAEEYFDISIGKTPPRKEPQWFSKDSSDCVWVSISDMGSCGLYIGDSSEYLTHDAVERFNVKIVPDNTVILSFKLTVGRVAITDGCMTTNEAIAHFKTSQPKINEYLYCYLKNFNFQTMGSTSSIATAVNSKMVKGMPFIVPTDEELEKFHSIVSPLFTMIKSNQRESKHLAKLRDALLPKLMSGEIDVSDVKL